jgi:hypothetical protein
MRAVTIYAAKLGGRPIGGRADRILKGDFRPCLFALVVDFAPKSVEAVCASMSRCKSFSSAFIRGACDSLSARICLTPEARGGWGSRELFCHGNLYWS